MPSRVQSGLARVVTSDEAAASADGAPVHRVSFFPPKARLHTSLYPAVEYNAFLRRFHVALRPAVAPSNDFATPLDAPAASSSGSGNSMSGGSGGGGDSGGCARDAEVEQVLAVMLGHALALRKALSLAASKELSKENGLLNGFSEGGGAPGGAPAPVSAPVSARVSAPPRALHSGGFGGMKRTHTLSGAAMAASRRSERMVPARRNVRAASVRNLSLAASVTKASTASVKEADFLAAVEALLATLESVPTLTRPKLQALAGAAPRDETGNVLFVRFLDDLRIVDSEGGDDEALFVRC